MSTNSHYDVIIIGEPAGRAARDLAAVCALIGRFVAGVIGPRASSCGWGSINPAWPRARDRTQPRPTRTLSPSGRHPMRP